MKTYKQLPLAIITAFFLTACSKFDVNPVTKLNTLDAIVEGPTATLKGQIIDISNTGGDDFGFCYATHSDVSVDDNTVSVGQVSNDSFSALVDDLDPDATYYVKAYCKEGNSYLYGNMVSFQTVKATITFSEPQVLNRQSTQLFISSEITSSTGFAIMARGVCWSTDPTPTLSDNFTEEEASDVFFSLIKGLFPGTTYHIRSYATNIAGTFYSETISAETLPENTMMDMDGNLYPTVIVDSKEWMAEDLKTTKYNDGSGVPHVNDNDAWAGLSSPAYCWYDDDEATYGNTYGALYNWYAVETSKLCPLGWHVATDAELNSLVDNQGGYAVGGGHLKSTRTQPDDHPRWNAPNTGATNQSGLAALPSGMRFEHGEFHGIGEHAAWWSTTPLGTGNAWYFTTVYDHPTVTRSAGDRKRGFSVRCVKD